MRIYICANAGNACTQPMPLCMHVNLNGPVCPLHHMHTNHIHAPHAR